MLRTYIVILFFFLDAAVSAQSKIELEIKNLPQHHPAGSDIYLAGSFNSWNPQDEKFRFEKDSKGNYSFKLQVSPGIYEYKLTRGSWTREECRKNGEGRENRLLKVEGDAKETIDIEAWKDLVPAKPKTSTASPNVRVIDTAFLLPQLNRVRRIWIYLPENYTSGDKKNRYPVLYMHDGQNVFDVATAYSGEWGADEMMDTSKLQRFIIVAIDHGGDKRNNEYNPYDNTRFGKGEGDAYLDFMVKTLKPYIDKNYRTLRKRKDTYIAGSSMGGLITTYALLKYPKVFGGAGIFSPSFWLEPGIFQEIRNKGRKVKANIFFYAGKHEDETMVPNMLRAFGNFAVAAKKSKIKVVIRDEGRHSETSWRAELPKAFEWIRYGTQDKHSQAVISY